MMNGMEAVLIALLAVAVAAIVWLAVARRPSAPVVAGEVPAAVVQQAVALAVADANDRAARERDLAVQDAGRRDQAERGLLVELKERVAQFEKAAAEAVDREAAQAASWKATGSSASVG